MQISLLKTVFRASGALLLLNSCSSAPEKPTHHKYTVEIKQMKFLPAELIVEKGDTVVWINKDIVTHDITEEPAKAWSSGPLTMGQSWTFVITGNAEYYCSIHVVMKGKLLLKSR